MSSMISNARQSLVILPAIVTGSALVLTYQDGDGVISTRGVIPSAIERCANGETVVRCYDLNRKAPRCFRLERIMAVARAESVATTTATLGI